MFNRPFSPCHSIASLCVLLAVVSIPLAALAQSPDTKPPAVKPNDDGASQRESALAQYLRQELEKISGDAKTGGKTTATPKTGPPLVKPTPAPEITPTFAPKPAVTPTPVFGIFPPQEKTATPVATPSPIQTPPLLPVVTATPVPPPVPTLPSLLPIAPVLPRPTPGYSAPIVTANPKKTSTQKTTPTPDKLVPRKIISLPPYGQGQKEKTPDLPPQITPGAGKNNISPIPTPSPYPSIRKTPIPKATPRPTLRRTPTLKPTPTQPFVNPARILPSTGNSETVTPKQTPALKPTVVPTLAPTPAIVPMPTPKLTSTPMPTPAPAPTPALAPELIATPEMIVEDVDTRFALLVEMARKGKRQEARQRMAELAGANPEHPRAAEIRFAAALFEDDESNRLSAFRTVMVLHSDSPWASKSAEEMGDIYFNQAEYGTAIEMFQTRIKSMDKKEISAAPLYVRIASCYLAMGQYKAALAPLKRVKKDATPSVQAQAQSIRGECLLGLGKCEDAVEVLQTLVLEHQAFADKARALLILGLCYEELDQRPNAIETYRNLLTTCPDTQFESKAAKERLSGLTRTLL